MANKACTPFVCRFLGDGSSSTVSIQFGADPVALQLPGEISALSSIFSALPTAVSGPLASGLTVTGFTYTALTGTLVVTFDDPPASGVTYDLTGLAIY